ncbi:hypothetical protein FRB95_005584 [Tulasnella sp. JGI-2019a]|nr:hypothetical protein FRB95_005584 [Tulasnella sp. JGI-2019a]
MREPQTNEETARGNTEGTSDIFGSSRWKTFRMRYPKTRIDSTPRDPKKGLIWSTPKDITGADISGLSKDDEWFSHYAWELKDRGDNSNSEFGDLEKIEVSRQPEPNVSADEDDSYWEANNHWKAGGELGGRMQEGKFQGNIRESGHSNLKQKGYDDKKSGGLPSTTDEDDLD